MSAISNFLTFLRSAIYAIDVRDGIADAIEQCYNDVNNPTLKTEALEAALQTKIDEGEMAALTIGDGTITAAKLASGVIDNTLATSGAAADAKKTGDEISAIKADLGAVGTKKQASDYVWNIGEIKASGSNGTSYVHARLNDFVQVSAGDMITFDISTYLYKIFFYSSNVASSCTGNTEFDDSDWTYTVESDCYIRICVHNNPSHTMTAEDRDRIASTIYFVSAGSLFKDVANVEGGTSRALAGLDTYEGLIIDGRARNLFAESKAVDGYLNGQGGVQTNNFTTITSEFIKLDPSETYLTLQTWQELPSGVTQWQAFAFYNDSKTNVGGRFVGPQEEVNYQSFEKAIPSGAAYVRVSSRAYGNHKIMLQYGRTCSAFEYAYEDINAIKDSIAALNAAPSNDTCVKAINHRGWSACPENTLIAYKESKRHGFNIVETDVQFTSDNVPVLLHDGTINRTARNSDGTTISGDISIKNITYAEALNYDFGIYKGTEFAGEPIPTLAEFLRLCKRLGLKAYVEIKNDVTFTTEQIQSVVDEVIKAGMIDVVTFISFSHDFLGIIKEYAPSVRLGLLTTTLAAGYVQRALALKTTTNEVFIDSDKWGADGVQACIDENMPLEVWTVDRESTLLGLPDYVTGVTSNSLIASKVLENAVLG